MFIATNHLSNSLRSVRGEISFQPASAPRSCAPTEREPNSVTSGYKQSRPAGAKSVSINSLHFILEFAFTN